MEFIVTRNKKLWTDGFVFEEDAIDHMEKSQKRFNGDFEVLEVTDKELDSYYNKDERIDFMCKENNMEDKAIRILDLIDQYNNLDNIYGETREEVIGWIVEILEEE